MIFSKPDTDFNLLRYLPFLALIVIIGCNSFSAQQVTIPEPPKTDAEIAAANLQSGDLVVRADDDIVGLSLRNMNDSDKAFSHSGMAFMEDSSWFVYHMMAGEENPSLEMRRDPLAAFIDPKEKSGYGIYRYNLEPNDIDSLHRIITSQYQHKLRFDTAFNLRDSSAMYCSEMVATDLARVTGGSIKIPTTQKSHFSFKARAKGRQPARDIEYYAIDNLYLNPWCHLIFRKEY